MNEEYLINFVVGDTYRLRMGVGKLYKIHILALVDEHVVYKWYGRHKQWWHYNIDDEHILSIKINREKR